MQRTLQLLVLATISTACAGTSTAPTTATTPPPAVTIAPTTTTTTTTTSTTTTIPPTTTTVGPITEADFDALYRELDAIRGSAYLDPSIDHSLASVTEWSATHRQIKSFLDDDRHSRARQPGEYTVDRIELYDRPSEDLAILLVRDTVTSPFVVVDAQDEEVTSSARSVPSLEFLVTMVATDDGWRIGADLQITDLETELPELLNLDAPADANELPIDTTNVSARIWSEGTNLCAEMRALTPEIGRMVSCEPWEASLENFSLSAFPFFETDGTAHKAFRVDSPGGQVYEVKIDTDSGEVVTVRTVASERPPYRVGFALFEGEPKRVRLYSEAGEILFDNNP